jgi:hypothetical protein
MAALGEPRPAIKALKRESPRVGGGKDKGLPKTLVLRGAFLVSILPRALA